VELPFSKGTTGGKEPALFYRTSLRPDRLRPDAEVILVAMDTRRLDLGMAGGYEAPLASASLPGHGRLPTEPQLYRRVVAKFNGASPSLFDDGMVVDGRVLVPPAPGRATVHIDRSGRVGLGTWPAPAAREVTEEPTAPARDAALWSPRELPPGIVSLRQSGEPLLTGGALSASVQHPTRNLDAVATERTALCVTRSGQLVFAWGERATRDALAEALRMVSCDYALPLATGASRGSFQLVDIANLESEARALPLDERMTLLPAHGSSADFFYVALREGTPTSAGFTWQADPGAQPPPASMPGIYSAREELASLVIELTRFEAGRFSWLLGPSRAEATSVVVDTELPPEKAAQVVARIGLGHTTDRTRYGLTAAGQQLLPLQRALGTVIFPRNEEPYLAPSGVPVTVPGGAEAVQLPVLAQDGSLTDRARELGGLRSRGALCQDDQGNLLVARLQHDSSAPAARALLALGCRLVLELDRGSHSAPFVERTGTSAQARDDDATVLHALGREPSPRGYAGMPAR
jgi:hypothetical protein